MVYNRGEDDIRDGEVQLRIIYDELRTLHSPPLFKVGGFCSPAHLLERDLTFLTITPRYHSFFHILAIRDV